MDTIDTCENMEGRDDIDDGIPTDPHPTYRDALKAASTLCWYIEDWNDPIARKMEAILASFNMKICMDESKTMKDTVLADDFHRP